MKIDTERLNEQQKINLRDALNAYERKQVVSSPSPPVLYIELTQNCNGRCDFCRGETWCNDPRYNMSQKLFKILLREYIPFATLVDLRVWGESLILPDFDKYVASVARLGPSIRLTTNLGCGTPAVLQSIVDHDVFISVSIDAAEKSLFERIRKGVSYDTVMKNLAFLATAMRKKTWESRRPASFRGDASSGQESGPIDQDHRACRTVSYSRGKDSSPFGQPNKSATFEISKRKNHQSSLRGSAIVAKDRSEIAACFRSFRRA